MNRRSFLAAAAAYPATRAFARINRQRLTILADEAGPTPEDWIAFARDYQLKWLELRSVQQNGAVQMLDSMSVADLKPIAAKLKDAGLGVSFFNSALLKHDLPGTVAVRREDWYDKLYARQGLTSEGMYRDRNERLKRAIAASLTFGCTKLRTFTFWRVAEPRAVFPRLVEILGGMADAAKAEGCELLVETEFSTNIATSEEIRDLLAQLPHPAIGINWDPQNSYVLEKDIFPAGYAKLPKARIRNVQIKAEGLFGKELIDWAGIFRAMDSDGYQGLFGLETHNGNGPENYKMSRRCMDEMLRLIA